LRDQEMRTNSLKQILQECLLGLFCLNTSTDTTSAVEAEFTHLSAGERYREGGTAVPHSSWRVSKMDQAGALPSR